MPIAKRLSFREHPIEYLYLRLLKVLIGKRPVLVNVTIHRPEDPQGPLAYFPQYARRHNPLFYNINLTNTENPRDALITSNPE